MINLIKKSNYIFKQIFSGRQQLQDVKIYGRFGNQLRPHLQGMLVVW
jgi:hypothetical protein